jgi:hypothetical protein
VAKQRIQVLKRWLDRPFTPHLLFAKEDDELGAKVVLPTTVSPVGNVEPTEVEREN